MSPNCTLKACLWNKPKEYQQTNNYKSSDEGSNSQTKGTRRVPDGFFSVSSVDGVTGGNTLLDGTHTYRKTAAECDHDTEHEIVGRRISQRAPWWHERDTCGLGRYCGWVGGLILLIKGTPASETTILIR